jgi:hypothetical protein
MTKNTQSGRPMTAEDVVRRIAAECAFIGANGEVGIRLKLAAAIVRQVVPVPLARFASERPPRPRSGRSQLSGC